MEYSQTFLETLHLRKRVQHWLIQDISKSNAKGPYIKSHQNAPKMCPFLPKLHQQGWLQSGNSLQFKQAHLESLGSIWQKICSVVKTHLLSSFLSHPHFLYKLRPASRVRGKENTGCCIKALHDLYSLFMNSYSFRCRTAGRACLDRLLSSAGRA